jgi:predicted ATPase/DNA-binding CsgD family transcriptional regulator
MISSAASPLAGSSPIPRTRLIGRHAERATAQTLLLDEAVPLLTLTGPGGVGKTRLALAVAGDVAGHFADGVVWVDLAPLGDASLVPGALAAALGFVPAPDQPVVDGLSRFLRPRQTLLLLDNCEHVLGPTADLVVSLLVACPALQILATSRAPLHVRGEQELPVEPLPLPHDAPFPAVNDNDAVRLFVERVRAIRPSFALDEGNAGTVAAICRHLDGLPLAIELAAARIKVLSPEALLALMTDRLRLLNAGPRDLPARQQTIRDTIAWSYGLVAPEEQALFRLLAVFTGGWTLGAAQAVSSGDSSTAPDVTLGLFALVDQSLVRRIDQSDEPRFTMLETIRAFGLEQLEISGEEPVARRHHAAHMHAFIAGLDLYHAFPGDPAWLDRLALEQDNLRQALAWFADRGDALPLNDLSASLYKFWLPRSQIAEGRRWLGQAIAIDAGVPVLIRARARGAAGFLAAIQGDFAVAQPLLDEALALARDSGDPVILCEALIESGLTADWRGDRVHAVRLMEEAERAARAVAPGLPIRAALIGMTVEHLGRFALDAGDIPRATTLLEEAVELQRAPGGVWGVSITLGELGLLRLGAGAVAEGTAALLEAIGLTWGFRDETNLTRLLRGLAIAATGTGQPARAAHLLGAADAIDRRVGNDTMAQGRDRELIATCSARLTRDLGEAERLTLHRMGLTTTIDQTLALAYAVAGTVLGDDRAATIWRSTGIPEPEMLIADSAPRVSPPGGPDLAIAPRDTVNPQVHVPAGFDLTRRERQILALLAERLTDAAIAEAIFLSVRTVEHHVANILAKLGAANRREAAAIAVRHALV